MAAKGQLFIMEVFIVTTIAILIVTVLFSIMAKISDFTTEEYQKEILAEEVANILILYQGDPRNWNSSLLPNSLGLARRRNLIDSEKISALNSTNYKELLGIYKRDAKFSIFVNDSKIWETGDVNESKSRVVVERNCVINSSPCKFRIEIT